MSPLECTLVIILMTLPFVWLVGRHFRMLADPRYLRNVGVVIVADSAIERHSAPIGEYMRRPIWGTVTFMGMEYRFDRVIDARERERIAARELYLEPGLVYVTE